MGPVSGRPRPCDGAPEAVPYRRTAKAEGRPESRQESPLRRSLTICRIAGIPLKLHWAFFILPIVFLWSPLLEVRTSPSWLPQAAIELGLLIVAIVLHEFAHAATARAFRAEVKSVTLWPLGGFTEISGMPGTARAEVALSLSGSVCNLALAGLGYGLAAAGDGGWTFYAKLFGYWNLLLGSFNLVPTPPLDGGTALQSILNATLGHARGDLWAARIGLGAAAAVAIIGLLLGNNLALIVGLAGLGFSYRLLRQNRFTGYSPRVPKTGDFRAWRLPKDELDAEIKRKRASDRADGQMRERVDQLLKRISTHGMESLSESDREFLRSASERIRSQQP